MENLMAVIFGAIKWFVLVKRALFLFFFAETIHALRPNLLCMFTRKGNYLVYDEAYRPLAEIKISSAAGSKGRG